MRSTRHLRARATALMQYPPEESLVAVGAELADSGLAGINTEIGPWGGCNVF